MKRRLVVLCVAILALGAAGHFAGGESAAAQSKLKTFQLVLLKKGSQPIDRKVLAEHGAYMKKLGADGVSAVAGPITDDGDVVGAMIVRDRTVEEATAIEAADPAVQAGIFTVVVMPFLSADQGQFQPWATPFAPETVYLGFLKNGPNRGQSKEEASRLQKEHLAYMDSQAQLGKLIVAGPFVEGGEHRGIVVYRVDSREEARSRADGDPAVKVGRLVAELHPWLIPKGALR